MATSTNDSSMTFVVLFYGSDLLMFTLLPLPASSIVSLLSEMISNHFLRSEYHCLPVHQKLPTKVKKKKKFFLGVSTTYKLWILALCTRSARLRSITWWQDLFYIQSSKMTTVCDKEISTCMQFVSKWITSVHIKSFQIYPQWLAICQGLDSVLVCSMLNIPRCWCIFMPLVLIYSFSWCFFEVWTIMLQHATKFFPYAEIFSYCLESRHFKWENMRMSTNKLHKERNCIKLMISAYQKLCEQSQCKIKDLSSDSLLPPKTHWQWLLI